MNSRAAWGVGGRVPCLKFRFFYAAIALCLLLFLSSCSTHATASFPSSGASGAKDSSSANGSENLDNSDVGISKSPGGAQIFPGDARLEGDKFFLYTGKFWQELSAPPGFSLSFTEKKEKRFTSLISPDDPLTSLLFSEVPQWKDLPDITALRNQLALDLPESKVEKRADIGNWGDSTAVVAQSTASGGRVSIVAVAKIDNRMWSVTVNASNQEQADSLYDVVQAMRPVRESDLFPQGSSENNSSEQNYPFSLHTSLKEGVLEVSAGEEKITLNIPTSFVLIKDEQKGIEGGADRENPAWNITFAPDKEIQSLEPSKILSVTRASLDKNTVAEILTLPEVSSVAGYPAGAVETVMVNGARSRLYVVKFEVGYVQIVVNEPQGDVANLQTLTKAIGNARS